MESQRLPRPLAPAADVTMGETYRLLNTEVVLERYRNTMSENPEFKINLSEKFPHLPKAPIIEAVIAIEALADGEWVESAVSKEFKRRLPDYPLASSQNQLSQEFKFTPGKPLETAIHNLGWKGLRFQSADGQRIAQFNKDGFVFSWIRPYKNWESLVQEALRLWELHVEVARPAEAQGFGVRFINRIELPPQELRFEHYIDPHPKPPQRFPLPFYGFLHQDTLAVPGGEYAINVIRTFQPPQPPGQGGALILDIDVINRRPVDLGGQIVENRLAEMRWLKNKVFFGSITEKALEQFK
jgi:uncharacterized protein (TIGR04255 family)